MIASLPMYERPENVEAHDHFWSLIRDALRRAGQPAPDCLDRKIGTWQAWESGELLLSQTCGLPLRSKLHDRVRLVGTPDFMLPDTPAGYYRSVFICRKHDDESVQSYADRILAYNGGLSQSGWAAPQSEAQKLGFRFRRHLETGGHRNSVRAVTEGRADIAAIDEISWRLIRRHDAWASGVKVISRTAAVPGLPYITSRRIDPAPLLAAIRSAIANMDEAYRQELGIGGLVEIPLSDYLETATPPAPGTIPGDTAET